VKCVSEWIHFFAIDFWIFSFPKLKNTFHINDKYWRFFRSFGFLLRAAVIQEKHGWKITRTVQSNSSVLNLTHLVSIWAFTNFSRTIFSLARWYFILFNTIVALLSSHLWNLLKNTDAGLLEIHSLPVFRKILSVYSQCL